MKNKGFGTRILKVFFLVVVFQLFAFFLFAASNVVVSPDALVSDTGAWLQLTADVASGSDIEITIIVDYNNDGVQSGPDFIFKYYHIKEGVAPLLPGSPKPGDEDGQNGHLLTHIDLWSDTTPASHFMVRVQDSGDSASDQVTISQPATGQSVSGILRNEYDNAIAGFIISMDQTGREWFAATNADGTYTINLPSGQVSVAGFAFWKITDFNGPSIQTFVLDPGEHKLPVNLKVLGGNYGVLGQVKDTSTNQGVPYMMVFAETENLTANVITDGAGNFYIALLNGTWEIGLDSAQCNERGLVGICEKQIVVNNSGVLGVNFDLSPANTYITGKVKKKKDDSPLVSYTVKAESETLGRIEGYTHGPDGSYVLLVKNGDWRVNVDDDDVRRGGFMMPQGQDISPAQGSPATGIDFLLEEPTSLIEVLVKDKSSSDPVSDIGVSVSDQNWENVGFAQTDAEGKAKFGVVEGAYRVGLNFTDLSARDYIAAPNQEAIVGTSETKHLVFEIEKGEMFINGTLLLNTSPVSGVNVTLYDSSRWWLCFAESQADGSYHIPVKAGAYYVQPDGGQLIGRNIAPTPAKETSLTSGTRVVNFNLSLPTATVDVQVVGGGVVNLPNITVFIGEDIPDQLPLANLSTDSSGMAHFRVVAGSYILGVESYSVMQAGYLPRSNKSVSVASSETKYVDFFLRPYTSRIAMDAILNLYAFDNWQRNFLDANQDGRLDIADVITLIIQGK